MNVFPDITTCRRTKIYTISGEPIPLARPRVGKQPYSRVYDSQKQLKLLVGIGLSGQHNDEPLFCGPLWVDLTFHMRMPMGTAEKKAKMQGLYHIARPDSDNLTKFYLDVANGIVYEDDCIICCLTVKKIYDLEPKTVMTVCALKG